MSHVEAVILGFEDRGFRFELIGSDLDITTPAGFGQMSDEDMDWFRRRKPEVISYLLSREWPATDPVSGTGPCCADDCEGKVTYLAGRGECDRCRIPHRVVANGALRSKAAA